MTTLLLASSIGGAASAYCRTTSCKTCPLDATGCPSGGVAIAWQGACVSYSLAERASSGISLALATTAAEKAFTTWSDALCAGTASHPSITTSNAFGPTLCDRHEYNPTEPNANIIVFREDTWPYGTTAANALAITSVTFDSQTGQIFDADIEINGFQPISADDSVASDHYDLQSILTHEAGHFLGLAHSTDPQATMWSEYSAGSARFRELTSDDVAGICAIYPPDRSAGACSFTPRQGFSSECAMPVSRAGACALERGGASGTRVGWVLWAFGLTALGACRSRRLRTVSG